MKINAVVLRLEVPASHDGKLVSWHNSNFSKHTLQRRASQLKGFGVWESVAREMHDNIL